MRNHDEQEKDERAEPDLTEEEVKGVRESQEQDDTPPADSPEVG